MIPVRLHPFRSAPKRFAFVRSEPERSALIRFAPPNTAPLRLHFESFAPKRFAPEKLAFEKLLKDSMDIPRSAPFRLAPDRSKGLYSPSLRPVRLALSRLAFASDVEDRAASANRSTRVLA